MLVITPYESVGPIRFEISVDELIAVVGKPKHTRTHSSGEMRYEYQAFGVTLSATDQAVVEVGLLPRAGVQLRGVDVFGSPTAFEELIAIDGAPYESLGFIVLPSFGITLTGFHDNDPYQRAVTA